MVLLIGLTGNIAVGKSTVLAMLAAHGAYTIDADQGTHRVLAPDGGAYAQVVATWPQVVGEDGTIDRAALGQIVFRDAAELAKLEEITHPAISKLIWDEVAEAERSGYEVIVIDAVKLLEGRTKLGEQVDSVWVVVCDLEQQRMRLMARNNLSAEQAQIRLAAQPPVSEKLARADVVIDNSGSLEQTRVQVDAAWAKVVGQEALSTSSLPR
ncbi:MAG: dephospho-CoA kinase [Candidatus Chloroheliales bacterium]|nr:MAG: dephospho-CoA kinase [Chloroflexota bacterium]